METGLWTLGLVGAPAFYILLQGRRLIAEADAADIDERWTKVRERSGQVCLTAMTLLLLFGAGWPALFATATGAVAAGYPARKRLLKETWGLPTYLLFRLRTTVAPVGILTAIGVFPFVVVWPETWSSEAALGLGSVLFVAWWFWDRLIFLVLGARPSRDANLIADTEALVQRSMLTTDVRVHVAGDEGGIWPAAITLPGTKTGHIIVSRTLLRSLNRSELRVVLAERIAHLEQAPASLIRLSRFALELPLVVGAVAFVPGLERMGLGPEQIGLAAIGWALVASLALLPLAYRERRLVPRVDRRTATLVGDPELVAATLAKIYALAWVRAAAKGPLALRERLRAIQEVVPESGAASVYEGETDPEFAALAEDLLLDAEPASSELALELRDERQLRLGARQLAVVLAGQSQSAFAYSALQELRLRGRASAPSLHLAATGGVKQIFELLPVPSEQLKSIAEYLERVVEPQLADAPHDDQTEPWLLVGHIAVTGVALAFIITHTVLVLLPVLLLPLFSRRLAPMVTLGAVVTVVAMTVRGQAWMPADVWLEWLSLPLALLALAISLAWWRHHPPSPEERGVRIAALALVPAVLYALPELYGALSEVVRSGSLLALDGLGWVAATFAGCGGAALIAQRRWLGGTALAASAVLAILGAPLGQRLAGVPEALAPVPVEVQGSMTPDWVAHFDELGYATLLSPSGQWLIEQVEPGRLEMESLESEEDASTIYRAHHLLTGRVQTIQADRIVCFENLLIAIGPEPSVVAYEESAGGDLKPLWNTEIPFSTEFFLGPEGDRLHAFSTTWAPRTETVRHQIFDLRTGAAAAATSSTTERFPEHSFSSVLGVLTGGRWLVSSLEHQELDPDTSWLWILLDGYESRVTLRAYQPGDGSSELISAGKRLGPCGPLQGGLVCQRQSYLNSSRHGYFYRVDAFGISPVLRVEDIGSFSAGLLVGSDRRGRVRVIDVEKAQATTFGEPLLDPDAWVQKTLHSRGAAARVVAMQDGLRVDVYVIK